MMGGDTLDGRFVQIVDMQKGGENTPNIATSYRHPTRVNSTLHQP